MAQFEEVGEAEVIDEWLDKHTGTGIECYTHTIKVYFPVASRKAEEEFEELLKACNEVFGGSTVYDAEGSWCEEKPCREVIREPVKVIEASHHCTEEWQRERFAEALKKAARNTNQQAVAIKGTNRFFIIPSHLL